MKLPIIDSHIHIDQYTPQKQVEIMEELPFYKIEALIAVSNHLSSAKRVQQLAQHYNTIKPAYGFHPEQPLPTKVDVIHLLDFIDRYHNEMIAIGEVGLPYYKKQKNPNLRVEPYIDILKTFMKRAKLYEKPIVLHAIYEDSSVACDLLEKFSITYAHFHWFKGNKQTVERMIANEYYISITPDIFYKERTRELVKIYPLHLMMVETDGPWQFEGPFKRTQTHPKMIHHTIFEIARIKRWPLFEVYDTILQATKNFYQLP